MESANGKDEAGTARSEAIDIDLITHAYRSLSDPSAFDALVDAWNYKLEQVDSLSNNRLPVLAAPLLTHLDQLADFARTTQTGIPDDPIRMAVERDESAAMVQTSDGRIVATNDAGEHLFGAATGSIDPLHWLDPTSCQDLEAVRRTVMGRGNRHRAILKIAPVGPDNLPAGTALAEASILHVPAADRGMLVIRSLALPWTAAVIPALQQPFQLTDAETDIARLFYQHRDLAEVARIRGVSLQTVRTQIKTILQKTECDGQAALLHLVTLLCARVRAEVPGAETGWLDPLGTAETIVRPCGARMTYSSVGAANGIPALWVHGPGFNYLLPQAMVEALRVAGIRLLMPHRPGHGNSEAAPGIDPIEDQVSR